MSTTATAAETSATRIPMAFITSSLQETHASTSLWADALRRRRAPTNPSTRNTVAIRSAHRVAVANPLVRAPTAVTV